MPEPLVTAADDAGHQPGVPRSADALESTVILPAQSQAPGGAPASALAPAPASALAPASAPAPALEKAPPAEASAAAGWYGKVPFLGDFASRRLPEAFIKPWDNWLQLSLAASRAGTGEGWLDLYLTFPVWRFVMPAGLVGDSCWIGIFLPSVDRVGRCFPLTICEPVACTALEQAGLIGIDTHLAALEETGIEALDATSVDFLEERLARLGPLRFDLTDVPPGPPSPIALETWASKSGPSHDEAIIGWPLNGSVPAVSARAASRYMVSALRGRVLWWSPAAAAGGSGALLLAPYPFPGRLLGHLIGTS